MTSERKAAANRRNAQKSTSPKTAEGKAAVALNGMRHGPLTRAALIGGEREADLISFARGLRASLAPIGELELLLADRVITCAWRLRRLLRLEGDLLKEETKLADALAITGARRWRSFRVTKPA
jgi:hypothetical protein